MVKRNRFVVVRYECEICGVTYKNKKGAVGCEKRPTEKQTFQVGDRVRAFEPRECSMCGEYKVRSGRVIKVTLVLADEEYENKWLGGCHDRLHSHVWQYVVEFQCKCPGIKTCSYYSPEIETVKKRSKKK